MSLKHGFEWGQVRVNESRVKLRLLQVQHSVLGVRFELMVWRKKSKASDDLDGELHFIMEPVVKPRER